ncbi:FMN-binding protein [Pectobacterium parmentieri]|uniref:FMN-binding protein n=1 Tax=Pectobacterium parmentieri TaxID=1905730 RepID=A0A8B3F9B0_PECPM|nr:FMN-binding protein [Pectobacterium parmentieri]AOR58076.1 FMN-binding protein [Pectobacterium parmentieri]AYH10909.1 FMN-binding protein [Pectobacterium parmentieri]AYH18379.1 FMN-binding protein [Pectobacterium parmentieri]AYH37191.1 FMN-binding protein [Pectobacterium parmentieri]AZS57420.1 FMN-binding protein [Pectobacterium parmentieri]
MKKSIPAVLTTLVMAFSLSAHGNNVAQYRDGTYIGKAQGKAAEIEVTVSIKEGKIANAEVLKHGDTEAMMLSATDEIVPELLEKQDIDKVDAVTGATLSSQGVINAVKQALEQAKVTP